MTQAWIRAFPAANPKAAVAQRQPLALSVICIMFIGVLCLHRPVLSAATSEHECHVESPADNRCGLAKAQMQNTVLTMVLNYCRCTHSTMKKNSLHASPANSGYTISVQMQTREVWLLRSLGASALSSARQSSMSFSCSSRCSQRTSTATAALSSAWSIIQP